MKLSNFTFVDVETTGLDSTHDQIIEVGLVRVENGTVVRSFKSCINPKVRISEEIKRITGINQAELMLSPTFDQVAEKLITYFPNSVVIAHNAEFDYQFLTNAFKRVGMDFSYPYLCTLKLCKEIYPYFLRYDLGTILRKMKIQYGTRHRAYEDATYVWEVFKGFQNSTHPEEFEKLVMKMIQKPKKKKVPKTAPSALELF